MSVDVGAPTPHLEHLLDVHIDLEAPQIIAAPIGSRQIWVVKSGTFNGPKLHGEVLSGGGDWATVRNDGATQLDVRATIRTHDGALIYVQYGGLLILPPEVATRIFSGQDVALSEYYFYTNPTFQTGDERYAWLNRMITIGRGKAAAGGVEYRVWTVQDPDH